MLSEEKKIYNLLTSPDTEINKLAQLTLLSKLTKDNVIYWYITLEPLHSIDSKIYEKMTTLLNWNAVNKPIESLSKIVSFIQENCPNPSSVEIFLKYYNQYLYSLLSHGWNKEKIKTIKSQITILNDDRSIKQSNKNL